MDSLEIEDWVWYSAIAAATGLIIGVVIVMSFCM